MISKEETIKKASELLDVSESSIAELPEENINAMISAFENVDVNSDEDKKILYEAIDTEWQKGSVLIILKELADNTGIAYSSLCCLDFETQKSVVFEYMADSTNMEHIYTITSRALALIELEYVSKLTGISFDELKALDDRKKEQICGHYSMNYTVGGSNTELAAEIKEMIKS